MKNIYPAINKQLALWILLLSLYAINAQTVQTFSYSGTTQTFGAPSCASTITVLARGAQGQAGTGGSPGAGGLGGIASGVSTVTAGQTLYITVGGQTGLNG